MGASPPDAWCSKSAHTDEKVIQRMSQQECLHFKRAEPAHSPPPSMGNKDIMADPEIDHGQDFMTSYLSKPNTIALSRVEFER